MIQWKFELDVLEIEEPVGFQDIVFEVRRDEVWHGIMFEATTASLKFYGEAFTYLQNKKIADGVDATVIFTASIMCEGEDDYQVALQGKLNFAQYAESCGQDCFVSLPVEQDDCTMILKNRFDQKVNIDSNLSKDGIVLETYAGLGFDMTFAAQEIPISADANVIDGGEETEVEITQNNNQKTLWRPIYGNVRDNSIITGQLSDPSNFFQDADNTFSLSPQVLLEENPLCIQGDWDYNVRMKGTITIDHPGTPMTISSRIVFGYWNASSGNLIDDITIIGQAVISANMTDNVAYLFDSSWTGSLDIPEGAGVYAYIEVSNTWAFPITFVSTVTIDYDEETLFYLYAVKSCPPTTHKVYLVNETLSRLTESITDRCLTVESDYYGRTNSEPYDHAEDGCGSLRVLTSGLRIRQADKDYFASLKEILEGLKAIDNIGMGIETDRLRIEPAEYFYQNNPILTLDLIPRADKRVNENLVYSLIKVGYKKWEIKSVKGIDEFNSTKEFRTNIKSVSRTLDISTDLIASGYIIETLRSSTLAVSGNADSTYDNDSFIICVERESGSYIVEQGNIEDAANLFSPTTAYNWRVRPMYNLMRWAKSIIQSYPIITNTAAKLYFNSGTGNYEAEGQLPAADDCRLENHVIAENDNLGYGDFIALTPIWKPETIEFTYPLSVRDYRLLKATPYGYINVQCGTGASVRAYIKTISYKPSKGEADFNLLLKWQ